MTTLTIRQATAADAELIADISRETFYETFAADNTPENMEFFLREQLTREMLIDEVTQPWHVFLLVFDGTEVAGYLKMRDSAVPADLLGRKCIEIARIYSVKSKIGKGVGKVLMQAAHEIAKEKGKEVLWLGVWKENQRAIGFYTRWNFEIFGEQDFLLGKDLQKDWLMKKELHSSTKR
ncbi:MAG TPA: GNAT family N-acetyltransferase [Chitinophagaceae bacterium]|jgi:ribosomal protein S18 acetylase RimI-like enzyme